jgi:hypothetical protein
MTEYRKNVDWNGVSAFPLTTVRRVATGRNGDSMDAVILPVSCCDNNASVRVDI